MRIISRNTIMVAKFKNHYSYTNENVIFYSKFISSFNNYLYKRIYIRLIYIYTINTSYILYQSGLLWTSIAGLSTHVSMVMSGVCVVLVGLSGCPLSEPGQSTLQPLRVCPTGVPTASCRPSRARRRRPER